jgi:iron complex outermembrane recepter protein
MTTVMRRMPPLLAFALGIALCTPPSWAQTTVATEAQRANDLEEVVVTARMRDETFQAVPITMNVFTAQTIQDAGIETPRDFIGLVPNMTMVETQNVGNSFVTIRGISQARNSEPSVAVLVDGVLQTNPYEFNEELYDLKQIEVLKGPQGALYGRNAIGGAIIIHTADPTDHFEASTRLGIGNGVSERVQAVVSGPIDDAGTLRYRASGNYYNTDGYTNNSYLNQNADPFKEYSGRLRLLWKPAERFTGDLRVYYDKVETTAFYFVIPRSDEANPFSDFFTPGNANDTSSPIQNNNLGMADRDIIDTALKLDYDLDYGAITSVTDYNHTKEIDTGDAYDFRPVDSSVLYALTGGIPASLGGPFDESQSQYIDVTTWSQELRFTAPKVNGFSWIAGAYYLHTDRFISTGNLADRGLGAPAVYHDPLVDPNNPFATNTNQTFLADTQHNNAWALFGDATYAFAPKWELDVAVRYDQDNRQNTTNTPTAFLPPGSIAEGAYTGQVRNATYSETQPKGTLRYMPNDNLTVYGGWSRGFRSGGFNQTGVGAVAVANGVLGVGDQFQAETVDTTELGIKSQWLDHRLSVDASVFYSQSTNGYFFVYIAANSTQNLGNLDADYKGAELSITARPTDRLELYASYGYTDSNITGMEDPTVIGNQAPLVSRDTLNAGFQYRQPLDSGLSATLRVDYSQIGRTWWEPYNITSRDPVSLVDARLGLQGKNWTVTAWSKNLTDTKYNAEFSPGNVGGSGFLWRALPRRYGITLDYRF